MPSTQMRVDYRNAIAYTVQSGDTLTKIANEFGVDLKRLEGCNSCWVPNPNLIHPGDLVVIPK